MSEEPKKDMYFVVLNHEIGKVIFTKVPIPVNCPDIEDYLDKNHIFKATECSFMCSDKPLECIYE